VKRPLHIRLHRVFNSYSSVQHHFAFNMYATAHSRTASAQKRRGIFFLRKWKELFFFTVMPRTTCPSCVRRSPKSPNDAPSFGQPPPTCRAKNTARHVTYGRRAFAVVGPTVWNALGNDLRDPELSIASFSCLLKTHLFQQYSVH